MTNQEYTKGVEDGYQIAKRLYQNQDTQAREAIKAMVKFQGRRNWKELEEQVNHIFSQPTLPKNWSTVGIDGKDVDFDDVAVNRLKEMYDQGRFDEKMDEYMFCDKCEQNPCICPEVSKMSFTMPCPICQFEEGHSRECDYFEEPEKPILKKDLKQLFNYREIKAIRESLVYARHRLSTSSHAGIKKSGVQIKDIEEALNKLK